MTELSEDTLFPDSRFALDLREHEHELRTDVVLGSETLEPHWQRHRNSSGRLALLTLTNERLFFRPPAVDWNYRFDAYIRWLTPGGPHPLTRLVAFELRDVKRVWTWQPAFSAAPALQFGAELVYIDLHVDEPMWTQRAKLEEIRSHFEAICSAVSTLSRPREPEA
jgi:hypothetical protein